MSHSPPTAHSHPSWLNLPTTPAFLKGHKITLLPITNSRYLPWGVLTSGSVVSTHLDEFLLNRTGQGFLFQLEMERCLNVMIDAAVLARFPSSAHHRA